MRFPKSLQKNGTIGFIAPSFGCGSGVYKACFDKALEYFNALGYKTKEGPNTRAEIGVGKSNTALNCANEINDFFTSDKADVIISCGGGETMCEDLSYVDFKAISKAEPKWFMGYSDNTNLTFTLTTLCDMASIYGSCAPSFGASKLHGIHEMCLDILTGRSYSVHGFDRWELESLKDESNPFAPYNLTEETRLQLSSSKVEFSGRLLGGCLDCLITLCGTRFDRVKEFNERYKEDGVIWFLEACDLNPMRMRCAMWQLKEAGWFNNAKGFIIGRPRLMDSESWGGMNHLNAVSEVIDELGVPYVMDVDLGHLPPAMPLICGSLASVLAKGNDIRIDMECR